MFYCTNIEVFCTGYFNKMKNCNLSKSLNFAVIIGGVNGWKITTSISLFTILTIII